MRRFKPCSREETLRFVNGRVSPQQFPICNPYQCAIHRRVVNSPKADLAKEILAGPVSVFHATAPTRPVTQALFRPNVSHDYDDGLADLLDVVGQNYRENEILAAHATSLCERSSAPPTHNFPFGVSSKDSTREPVGRPSSTADLS
jgi:hypothetical protein